MSDPTSAPAEGAAAQLPTQHYPVQPPPQQHGMVNAQYAVPVVVAAGPPRGLSITSMVLGLVSVAFGFTFILPLIAFILGLIALRREPAGRGMAITGMILGGLFLLGWLLLLSFGSLITFGVLASTSS